MRIKADLDAKALEEKKIEEAAAAVHAFELEEAAEQLALAAKNAAALLLADAGVTAAQQADFTAKEAAHAEKVTLAANALAESQIKEDIRLAAVRAATEEAALLATASAAKALKEAEAA